MANATFITNTWNSTDSNCFYELSVQLPDFPVNSWKVNIDWLSPVSIHGLWRARTDQGEASSHELQATYFNVDDLMDFTIQVQSEESCSTKNPIESLSLCTEAPEELDSESYLSDYTTFKMTTQKGEFILLFDPDENCLILSRRRAVNICYDHGTATQSFRRVV